MKGKLRRSPKVWMVVFEGDNGRYEVPLDMTCLKDPAEDLITIFYDGNEMEFDITEEKPGFRYARIVMPEKPAPPPPTPVAEILREKKAGYFLVNGKKKIYRTTRPSNFCIFFNRAAMRIQWVDFKKTKKQNI